MINRFKPMTQYAKVGLFFCFGIILYSCDSSTESSEQSMITSKLADHIQTYSNQGYHLSGSPGDTITINWMLDNLRSYGYQVSQQAINVYQLTHNQSYILSQANAYSGTPLYDSPMTSTKGVTGKLGYQDKEDTEILVLPITMTTKNNSGTQEFHSLRKSNRYKAIIVITQSDSRALAPLNSKGIEVFGTPVIEVDSYAGENLMKQAEAGDIATVVIQAQRQRVEIPNIIGYLEGTDPNAKPIFISTPRNGWYQSASERGPGIALWLNLAELIAQQNLKSSIYFVSFGGHDQGFTGLRQFVEKQADTVKAINFWLHIGANIAIESQLTSIQVSDENLQKYMQQLAANYQLGKLDWPLPTAKPIGSLSVLQTLSPNSDFIALVGLNNSRFHQLTDIGISTIDFELLLQYKDFLHRLIITKGSE